MYFAHGETENRTQHPNLQARVALGPALGSPVPHWLSRAAFGESLSGLELRTEGAFAPLWVWLSQFFTISSLNVSH